MKPAVENIRKLKDSIEKAKRTTFSKLETVVKWFVVTYYTNNVCYVDKRNI
jgi:hypothetical protein